MSRRQIVSIDRQDYDISAGSFYGGLSCDDRMMMNREKLLAEIDQIVMRTEDRHASMQALADLLRKRGGFRWVGLYQLNHLTATVTNIVWSGPGMPEYPSFPLSKGLTGSAVANRTTVNVGDVANDPRYLTAFGSTRSEIIIPVFDEARTSVVGTIDVESEQPNFFDGATQEILETCARVAGPLWQH